jgi:Ca2+-dependent lipid-binding protein
VCSSKEGNLSLFMAMSSIIVLFRQDDERVLRGIEWGNMNERVHLK